MNGRSPTALPVPEGAEARLRDALGAYAETVEPVETWPAIVARLDRRSSPLRWAWRHPLALGALSAAVVLVGALGIATLTGEGDQDLDLAPASGDALGRDAGLVGLRADGRVVALDPAGAELAELAELPGPTGEGASGLRTVTLEAAVVRATGTDELAVLVTSEPDGSCAAADQVLTDLVRLPLGTGEPSGAGDLSQVSALTASPAGTELAVVRHPGPACDPGPGVVEILDATSGEVRNTIALDPLTVVHQLVWLTDDRLVLVVQADPEVDLLIPGPEDSFLLFVVTDPSGADRLPAPLSFPVPAFTRVAAAPAGHAWLVAPTPPDGTFDDQQTEKVMVFRVDLDTGRVVQSSEIPDSQDADVLSVTGVGDQAFITLAAQDQVVAGTAGVGVTDPAAARLVRISSGAEESVVLGTGMLAVVAASPAAPLVEQPPAADPPVSTPPDTGPAATGPAWRAGVDDPGVIWITSEGQVRGIRPGTGGPIETLAELGTSLIPRYGGQASVSPDGRTLVVTSVEDGSLCRAHLRAVSLDDGTVQDYGVGHSPSFGPDGRLAFVEPGPVQPSGACTSELVVADTVTGEEVRFTDPVSTGAEEGWTELAAVNALVWSPAGDRIAFQRSYEGSTQHVVDLSAGGGVLPTGPLPFPTPGPDQYWELVGWTGTGDAEVLLARNACYGSPACDDGYSLVALVPDGDGWEEAPAPGSLVPAETITIALWGPQLALRMVTDTCEDIICDDPGYRLVVDSPDGEQVVVDEFEVQAAAWWPGES